MAWRWTRRDVKVAGMAVIPGSQGGTVEGGLVVRPRPWRQWPTALLVVAATALVSWVWAINVKPGKNLAFPLVLIILWGIYSADAFLMRLIVTPDRVRMISSHRIGRCGARM
jgi:hypothetical protein